MIIYPFPYYRNFPHGTPVIPDLYYNVYSYEERIKKLCMEYANLIDFTDSMVDTVNSQYEQIEEINNKVYDIIHQAIVDGEFDTVVQDAVQAWIDSRAVGTTYNDLKIHGFLY